MAQDTPRLEYRVRSIHGYWLIAVPEQVTYDNKDWIIGFHLYRDIDLKYVGYMGVRDAPDSLQVKMREDGFHKSRGKSLSSLKWWRRVSLRSLEP